MARRITGHSVGVIAVRNGSGVQREILSFPYTIKSPGNPAWTSIRVPMETGEFGESLTKTAERAFEEEIIRAGTPFSFKFLEVNGEIFPVHFTLGHDEKSEDPDDLHLKAFFLISFEGEFRTEIYREPGPRGLETHGLPEYKELAALLRDMKVIGKIRAHETAVLAAILPLCSDKETALHYGNLMSRYEEPEVLGSDFVKVKEYLRYRLK